MKIKPEAENQIRVFAEDRGTERTVYDILIREGFEGETTLVVNQKGISLVGQPFKIEYTDVGYKKRTIVVLDIKIKGVVR